MTNTYYSKDDSTRAIIEGGNSEKTLFRVIYKGKYSNYTCYEYHEIKLYKWARGLHGNAPSGTPYGYFRATKNGKRVILTV